MEFLLWLSIFLIFLIVYPQIFWIIIGPQNALKVNSYIKLFTAVSICIFLYAIGFVSIFIILVSAASVYLAIKNRVHVYSIVRNVIPTTSSLEHAWCWAKGLYRLNLVVALQQEVVATPQKSRAEHKLKVLWPISKTVCRNGEMPVDRISDASESEEDSDGNKSALADSKKEVPTKKEKIVRKTETVDVAIQAIRQDPPVDPRVQKRMNDLESCIRLEELRGKSFFSRIDGVEKTMQMLKSRVQTQEILSKSPAAPVDIESCLSPGALRILKQWKSATPSVIPRDSSSNSPPTSVETLDVMTQRKKSRTSEQLLAAAAEIPTTSCTSTGRKESVDVLFRRYPADQAARYPQQVDASTVDSRSQETRL